MDWWFKQRSPDAKWPGARDAPAPALLPGVAASRSSGRPPAPTCAALVTKSALCIRKRQEVHREAADRVLNEEESSLLLKCARRRTQDEGPEGGSASRDPRRHVRRGGACADADTETPTPPLATDTRPPPATSSSGALAAHPTAPTTAARGVPEEEGGDVVDAEEERVAQALMGAMGAMREA